MFSIFSRIICRKAHKIVNNSLQGKMMNKILKRQTGKRKKWHFDNLLPSIQRSPVNIHVGDHKSRRVDVLNKLFMRHITDLMSYGEISEEVLGYGINITRVKILTNFSEIRVFWVTSLEEKEKEIEDILKQAAGKLRRELTGLNVIGIVPPITFSKDISLHLLNEIDKLLSKADYGEDFEPAHSSVQKVREFKENYGVPEYDQAKINLQENLSEEDNDDIPPMRMDVLGINHAKLMEKIIAAKKKAAAPHRSIPEMSTIPEDSSTKESVHEMYIRLEEQKKNIHKLIKQKRIMREKILQHWSESPDKIYARQCAEEEYSKFIQDDVEEFSEGDFVDESFVTEDYDYKKDQ